MSENTLNVDLIVIGGGPAGVVGATTAASMGKKVALVEYYAELGGAGANTGPGPSKTLRETALALSGMRSRGLYGVDLSLRREATASDFLRHERRPVSKNGRVAHRRLYGNGLVRRPAYGSCSLHDMIKHNPVDQLLRGRNLLIATASSPV